MPPAGHTHTGSARPSVTLGLEKKQCLRHRRKDRRGFPARVERGIPVRSQDSMETKETVQSAWCLQVPEGRTRTGTEDRVCKRETDLSIWQWKAFNRC